MLQEFLWQVVAHSSKGLKCRGWAFWYDALAGPKLIKRKRGEVASITVYEMNSGTCHFQHVLTCCYRTASTSMLTGFLGKLRMNHSGRTSGSKRMSRHRSDSAPSALTTPFESQSFTEQKYRAFTCSPRASLFDKLIQC